MKIPPQKSRNKSGREMTACTVWACALLFNLSLESIFPVRQRGGHPLPCTVDYRNGRVDPSRYLSLFLSVFLFASLCCMARLASCYHGNKDRRSTVRTTEGERRGRKGRNRPPAETLGKCRQREKSSFPTSCLSHSSFSCRSDLSHSPFFPYLNPVLIHLAFFFWLPLLTPSPQYLFFCLSLLSSILYLFASLPSSSPSTSLAMN